MLAGVDQGGALGLGELVRLRPVQAAGVFEPRSEHETEEGGGQLVVLGVRGLRMLGDVAGRHFLGEAPLGVDRGLGQLASRRGHQPGDGLAGQEIGGRRVLQRLDRGGDEAHAALLLRGGRGKKGETRSW